MFVGKIQFYAHGPLASDKIVVVKGSWPTSPSSCSRKGVIDHPDLFMAGLQILGKASQLKAGEYMFKQHASLGDVMDTLVEGKSILHSVTVPEGLTSQQIVDRLTRERHPRRRLTDVPKEGSLLPDTYKFSRGMTRAQLARAHAAGAGAGAARGVEPPQRRPAREVAAGAGDAGLHRREGDRQGGRASRVAGVFINRLNRNMRLQSDPTIVYGLVRGKGTLGRGIMRSEIDQPTPYNTYPIAGPAAGPDRQSGPRGPGGRGQSVPHARALFRRRRHGRPRLRRDAGPAQEERRPVAPDGGRAPRRGAAGRRGGRRGGPVRARRRSGQAWSQAGGAAAYAPLGRSAADRRSAATPRPVGPRGNLDAVAGTPKDPLNNKSFDLNSPKVVPALRP